MIIILYLEVLINTLSQIVRDFMQFKFRIYLKSK